MEEIRRSGIGYGAIDGFDLAVTRQQVQQASQDFLQHRLRDFGPYEDAMSSEYATLYHSVLSPYLNLGLLEPMSVAKAVEAAYRSGDAPINSVEGFIRQIVGWREFMYWQYWRMMPDILQANAWQARRALPKWFWDAQTEMHCLHKVLDRVVQNGYVHHIERLMVLCNFAMMAEINPLAVNDWFTSTFIDAYEWVMAPNVLGMGLNADGGIIATKPYIASGNYINRMSDYCRSCRYNQKVRTGPDACPFNTLYWRFLIKHETKLRADPRLGRNVLGLRHLDDDERSRVMNEGDVFIDEL